MESQFKFNRGAPIFGKSSEDKGRGFKLKESSKLGPRPEKPIEIYEFESCPFCRKNEHDCLFFHILCQVFCLSADFLMWKQVREIVAVLDIDVLYYPCPRRKVQIPSESSSVGWKEAIPLHGLTIYLVCGSKPGVAMYESDDIIKYLVNKYGNGQVPLLLSLGLLTTLTEGFAMIGRLGRVSFLTNLYITLGSPFCKVVREVLVELELPHIQRRFIKQYIVAVADVAAPKDRICLQGLSFS
ncbi:GMP synthase [glutamine-hydrolyzing], partial [Bienertia sinuspersici]